MHIYTKLAAGFCLLLDFATAALLAPLQDQVPLAGQQAASSLVAHMTTATTTSSGA
jgi:hypothetical protein